MNVLGETILHLSVRLGHNACVKWIIENHPDLLTIENRNGDAPWKLAAVSGRVDILRMFFNDATKTDNRGIFIFPILRNIE